MMFELILVLTFGLFNLPKTTPCIETYGQCGGLQYTGSTQCCQPSTCEYQNPWYSQCLPSTQSSNTGCNSLYQQCGGQNWSGPTCCDYSVCTYSNPYYSQCLHESSSSGTSTSTKTSTTPSTTSSSSSSSSTASQGCSQLYAQCGGTNWNGATTCCSGSTCAFLNAYYSQCLPSGQPTSSSSPSSGSSSSSSSTTNSPTISTDSTRQSGVTTRYWDCCKASCGWPGKASVSNPVQTCARDGITVVDANTQSGCTGGSAYMCNNQQPWNVSETLSYGYAAAYISGKSEYDWCCACYSLVFTSGPVVGKELIVQVTNTGGDLGNNHFDLQMPGGGVGIFDGCSSQFSGSYSWGQRYGGISQRSDCANLPAVLQSGCYWRFDWFQNADNPTMSFKQVACPSALTANTQCVRN